MKKKMGRPPLPEGHSKDVQIGVRFKAKEIEQVEKSAAESSQDKAKWLRKVALEATEAWIKCDQWKVEDLEGKTVEFEVETILEGPLKGTGIFGTYKRGDGLVKIKITSYERYQPDPYTRNWINIYVNQEGVGYIKRNPKGSKCDFSLFDPAFQKCASGLA